MAGGGGYLYLATTSMCLVIYFHLILVSKLMAMKVNWNNISDYLYTPIMSCSS